MTNGLTATTNFISQKIDKNMVDSVTNAIFQRAASKAVVESNKNNAYSTDIYKQELQNDVMAEARKSLTASANPFAKGIFNTQTVAAAATANVTESQAGVVKTGEKAIVSGAVKQNSRTRVQGSMALQNSMFTSAMRESMMVEAKAQITNNTDLMSRLSFLNSKTAANTYPAARFN